MSSKSFKNHLRRDSLERSGLNAQKGRKCDPLEPSQEGSRLDESTVFTFPSGPKKYPNLWPKALKIEARCSQKPLRRGSKTKRSKHV